MCNDVTAPWKKISDKTSSWTSIYCSISYSGKLAFLFDNEIVHKFFGGKKPLKINKPVSLKSFSQVLT